MRVLIAVGMLASAYCSYRAGGVDVGLAVLAGLTAILAMLDTVYHGIVKAIKES